MASLSHAQEEAPHPLSSCFAFWHFKKTWTKQGDRMLTSGDKSRLQMARDNALFSSVKRARSWRGRSGCFPTPPGHGQSCSGESWRSVPNRTLWQELRMPGPQGRLLNHGLACADTAHRELEEKTHAGSSSALVQRVSLTSTEHRWETQ